MLVFIDESGDTGLEIKKGATEYFTIATVVFEENDEALACDQRFDLLRRELNRRPISSFIFIAIRKGCGNNFSKRRCHINFFIMASLSIRLNYSARVFGTKSRFINMPAVCYSKMPKKNSIMRP